MVCPIISGEETQGCNGRGDAGGSQRADQSCIFHSRNQLVGMLSLRDQRLAARLAVPSPIPISIAIAAHERPSERRLLILVRLTLTRGRPNCLPLALAFRNPARTRSAIRLRSNSATAPRTVKTILPVGVLVSTCSESETNSTPNVLKVSSALSR